MKRVCAARDTMSVWLHATRCRTISPSSIVQIENKPIKHIPSKNYPHLERRMQETLCTSHEFVLVFMQIKSEVENIVPMNDQALTRIEEQLLSILRKHVEQVAWRLTREGVIVESPLGWNTSLNEDQEKFSLQFLTRSRFFGWN
jgi:hypothetical protein